MENNIMDSPEEMNRNLSVYTGELQKDANSLYDQLVKKIEEAKYLEPQDRIIWAEKNAKFFEELQKNQNELIKKMSEAYLYYYKQSGM
jgi:hypothetical protein